MASTVFAYGCSHTFGTGLPDTVHHSGRTGFPVASRFAYPSLIARKRVCAVENHAVPGASCRQVHHRICQHRPRFHSGDTVIVQWPNRDRFCLFSSPRRDILPQDPDSTARAFYRHLYLPEDQDQENRFRIEHVEYLLGSRGVHLVQFATDRDFSAPELIPLRIDQVRQQFPLSADGWHMHTAAHEYIAETVSKYL